MITIYLKNHHQQTTTKRTDIKKTWKYSLYFCLASMVNAWPKFKKKIKNKKIEKKERKNIRFLPDSHMLVMRAFHRQRQAPLEFSFCALYKTAETCHQVILGVPAASLNNAYKEWRLWSAFPLPFCQSTAWQLQLIVFLLLSGIQYLRAVQMHSYIHTYIYVQAPTGSGYSPKLPELKKYLDNTLRHRV